MDTFEILYETYCIALQILPFTMTRCEKKVKIKIENHPKLLEIEKQVPSDVAFPFSFRKGPLNEVINGTKSLDKSISI